MVTASRSWGARWRDDQRGSGYHIVLMLVFLVAASLAMSVLLAPTQQVRDQAREETAGTEYESLGDTTLDRAWDAFRALPFVAVILGFVFAVVSAIILSSY